MRIKKFLTALIFAGLMFAILSPAPSVSAEEPATSQITEDIHTHAATTWKVSTPATALKDGLEYSTCSICGERMERVISHPAKMILSHSEFQYNGRYKEPAVTLYDANGNVIARTLYSKSYASNKYPGTGTVTITLNTSRYQATMKKTFKIKLPIVTFTSLRTRTEGFTARWEPQDKYITGYIVAWSTSSDFKNFYTKRVSPRSADSYVKKRLKSKTRYYVKIRSYMERDGKTYRSPWSTVKSIVTRESKYVKLVAVGDDLLHSQVYKSMKTSTGYNFDPMFKHIKDDVQAADLAVINQETILVKSNYSSYPCFGSPLKVADAIHKAGFNVVTHATNHTMDRGIDGITTTLNYWAKKYPDVTVLGIHKSQEDADQVKVVEKNGVKIAMLNYTYGLNGFVLPSSKSYMIDLLKNKTHMHTMIRKAKKQSDFVIVFAHWGTEYVFQPDTASKQWAQFFADEGVDLVIGGHPHVLEPIKKVKGKNGNTMICYYSLGNFISAQGNVSKVLGGMANVTIVKDSDGTRVKSYEMIPLVTHLTNGSTPYTTYKLEDYTERLASKNYIHHRTSETFTVARLKSLFKNIMSK